MGRSIGYDQVINHLFEKIPEFLPKYEKEATKLYASGCPYIIYGTILTDYLLELSNALSGPNSTKAQHILEKAFTLLEELASSDDFQTRCLVETGLLEALLDEEGRLKQFAPMMGPNTKELARSVADRSVLPQSDLDSVFGQSDPPDLG
jgi:hypothetical protein